MAGKHQDKSCNVFIINSGFQLFSSILIANNQPDKRNIFICIEKNFFEAMKEYGLGKHSFHLNIDKTKNPILKKLRVRRYLKKLFSIIEAEGRPEKVELFMAVIDGARYNYPIERAKFIYGRDNVSVNIIPDGICNTKINMLPPKKQDKVKKKGNSLYDKLLGLKYTTFHQDNHGILSDTIKSIYVIPEIPNEYPANKTVFLPKTLEKKTLINERHDKKNAIILGQYMVQRNDISKQSEKKISSSIREFLTNNNVSDVDYLPHPRAKIEGLSYDFHLKEAKMINTNLPAEIYLLNKKYDYIITSVSAALVSIKVLIDPQCQCVCIGAEQANHTVKKFWDEIAEMYKSIGVLVVSADS